MKRTKTFIPFAIALILLLCAPAQAAISLRAGMASPMGEFKELAKGGWTAQVLAEVRSLPIPALTMVVQFTATQFGQKRFDFASGSETHTQKSSMTLTGGGIGVRLAPSTLVVKPFAEILGCISSVQQEFRDNADKASMESKTKVGYEFNAGLRLAVSPGVDLEFGGGYTALAKTKLKHKETVFEIAPRSWQAFVGVALNLGL